MEATSLGKLFQGFGAAEAKALSPRVGSVLPCGNSSGENQIREIVRCHAVYCFKYMLLTKS